MRLRAFVLAAVLGGFPAAAGAGVRDAEEGAGIAPGGAGMGEAGAAAAAGCMVVGAVFDAASGAPIEEVALTLLPDPPQPVAGPAPPPLPLSAETGPDGRFCFPDAAPGRYVLRIARIGFQTPAPTPIEVGAEGAALFTLRLARSPFVELIVVRPEALPGPHERPAPPGFTDPPAPARALSREEILTLPGSLDDPARALTSLPGVAAINDYKGVLRLGGGEPEETVFLVDGVPIENPYHFHWSRGAAAGLSGAAFDRIAVRTSGIGAGVGDTISGAIELDPSERGAQGGFLEGSLGTIMASFTSGGAAPGTAASGDGSWVASVRYSNLALYRSLYGVEKVEVPDFGDLLLRLRRPIRPGLDLVAGGLALANSLQTSDPDEGSWDDIRARAGGAYAGLDISPGPDLFLSGRLSWSGARQRYDTSAGDHLDAGDRRLRLSLLAEGGGGAGTRDSATAGRGAGGPAAARWSAGVEGALQEGTIAGALQTAEGLQPLDARSSRLGAHAALRLRAGPAWSSEIGARTDRDSRFGSAPIQPRLSVEYASPSGWSARLGAGRYVQFPRFDQEFLAGGETLAPAVSDEVGAGATLPLPAGFAIDVSAYARRMKDLTSEIVNRSPDLRERMGLFERGRSRVIELSARREAGRLRARLSATLIDARQTRAGVTSARNGDQPYVVSLSAAWLGTPRWTLLGRLQAGAGLPYSAMEPGGEEEGGRVIGPLNGLRLPAFSRLDLRSVWERPAGAARLRAYFEIANAFGRRNLRGRDLRWDPASRRYFFRDEASMPLLPGFGLEIAWGGAAGTL